MADIMNYVGLFLFVGILVILVGGTVYYFLKDEKYRKEHKKDMIKGWIEGLIFAFLTYLLWLYGS